MKSYLNSLGLAAIGLALSLAATPARAVTVSIDSAAPASWLAFMTVKDLGGNFQFNGGWGVADATATFAGSGSGSTITLGVNSIGDPNPYWYLPSGGPGSVGNKIMEAAVYVEDASLVGQTVNFSGTILQNTFTSAHTSIAFIRDFAPDFSSFVEATTVLTSGTFNLSLATDPTPGRHVQYGFLTTGVNVWITDAAAAGSITIGSASAVPEPSSYAAIGGLAALAFVGLRRRRA